ncbi:hypothetical protein [Streptomyces sp. SCSIO ZS0520]|uniref:hypothetical protein n=1 Tax=Streptomyces sp. SCSIO ZS0520 TaxID=2892996 RepID=UPI0021DA4386|nr:hypothetical protein [Streptomyces sp. SCSIO ZS0520]
MSARRPLLTAAAAGALLGALWFVPSAGATAGTPAGSARPHPAAATAPGEAREQAIIVTTQGEGADTEGLHLADSGSIDTTPYVVGGTAFLCLGAGFVAYSVRRGRTAPEGRTAPD